MADEITDDRSDSDLQVSNGLRDEMVSAIYQYRSDLRHPLAADSLHRHLAWVEDIIDRIQREAAE